MSEEGERLEGLPCYNHTRHICVTGSHAIKNKGWLGCKAQSPTEMAQQKVELAQLRCQVRHLGQSTRFCLRCPGDVPEILGLVALPCSMLANQSSSLRTSLQELLAACTISSAVVALDNALAFVIDGLGA